ncbi:unnamed protein product [Agarophyton chilense]
MYPYAPHSPRPSSRLPYPSPLFQSQLPPPLPAVSLATNHPVAQLDGANSLPPFAQVEPLRARTHTVSTPPAVSTTQPPRLSLPFPVGYPVLRSGHPSPPPTTSPSISLPNTYASTASRSPQNPQEETHLILYDVGKLLKAGCTVFGGRVYNEQGHIICGMLNQHEDPCKRIGKCPFHSKFVPVSSRSAMNMHMLSAVTTTTSRLPQHASSPVSSAPVTNAAKDTSPSLPPRKQQFKRGWTKEEHYLFLLGLQKYGRGNWKKIAEMIPSRTATQVQSHAQKYFKRLEQKDKRKRSIHDSHLESGDMEDFHFKYDGEDTAPRWSPLLQRSGQLEAQVNNSGMVEVLQTASLVQPGLLPPNPAISSLTSSGMARATNYSSFMSGRGQAPTAELTTRTLCSQPFHVSDSSGYGASTQRWEPQQGASYQPTHNPGAATQVKYSPELHGVSCRGGSHHQQPTFQESMAMSGDGRAHHDSNHAQIDNRRTWLSPNNAGVQVGDDMWRTSGEWIRC